MINLLILLILSGLSRWLFKYLWSGPFLYHIRNLARYSFIFSFSYCKSSEIKSLLLHNLDSTIISNLGISCMASTHLWIKKHFRDFHLICPSTSLMKYLPTFRCFIQFSSSSPKFVSPQTRLPSQLLFWAIGSKVMAPLATLSGFLPHYETSSTMLRFPSWLNIKCSYL